MTAKSLPNGAQNSAWRKTILFPYQTYRPSMVAFTDH